MAQIQFNVIIHVDKSIEAEAEAFMVERIKETMSNDGFVSGSLCKGEGSPDGKVVFALHYRIRDKAAFQAWGGDKDMFHSKFGDKLSGTPRLSTEVYFQQN